MYYIILLCYSISYKESRYLNIVQSTNKQDTVRDFLLSLLKLYDTIECIYQGLIECSIGGNCVQPITRLVSIRDCLMKPTPTAANLSSVRMARYVQEIAIDFLPCISWHRSSQRRRRACVGLKLCQRRRRWHSFNPTQAKYTL